MIALELQDRIDHDKISTFLEASYASAPEAAWKLFKFAISYNHAIGCSLT